MIVTFSVIRAEDDIVKKEYTVLDKYDYCECKEQFANEVGVDYSVISDNLAPIEYLRLFGLRL